MYLLSRYTETSPVTLFDGKTVIIIGSISPTLMSTVSTMIESSISNTLNEEVFSSGK